MAPLIALWLYSKRITHPLTHLQVALHSTGSVCCRTPSSSGWVCAFQAMRTAHHGSTSGLLGHGLERRKDVPFAKESSYTVPILRLSATSNSAELRVRCVPATSAALKITDMTGAFSFTVTWCTPLPSTCTAMVI